MHDRYAACAEMAQNRPSAGHGQQGAADIGRLDRGPFDFRIGQCSPYGRKPEVDIGGVAHKLIAMHPDANDIDGTKLFQRAGHDHASR